MSVEARQQISDTLKANPVRYWLGKKMPFQHRRRTTRPLLEITRRKLSSAQQDRYADTEERKKTSLAVKEAMHRPDVRAKHIKGLTHSKWIQVRTDKGQLELLEKWNKLGFRFEPNYQVHTDTDLFYIDGYDVARKVVLEYDSKYHAKQRAKDLVRQQRIIDILKPKVFWRYDAVTKTFADVYRASINN